MNDTEHKNTPSPKKPGRRAGLTLIVVVLVAFFVTGMTILSMIGSQIRVPDYVRDRIIGRINSDISGFQIDVAEVSFMVENNWLPRLQLRGVDLRRADGVSLARLSDVESRVALKPLIRGLVQPAAIRLSGAQVKLFRAKDGTVNIFFGDTGEAFRGAPSFAALIGQVDSVLTQPHFAALDLVEVDNLTVHYEDARAGRAWTADGGRLEMRRNGDDLQIRGDVALLGGRSYATTLEMNYTGRIGQTAADLGVSFEDFSTHDISGQSPALAWLDALDAPISGALRASVDENGELGPLNATLRIGAGVLQPTQTTKPVAFNSARSYFTYDPVRQVMQFDELSLESNWVTARAEGQAVLVGMESGWPKELLGQFRVREISANPIGFYSEPVQLDAATMDMRLQMAPFRLSLGEMSFSDQGQRLTVSGDLRAEESGWNLSVDGTMSGLAPKRLLELWPESIKTKTRTWISENVRKANLSNIQFALRLLPKQRPGVFLGFDFKDLETRFLKKVPPIQGAAGHASMYDDRFVVTAERGHVTAAQGGLIDIAGTSFIIPNVRIKKGPARVLLKTESTITAALSLLDEEPFRFLQKAGQPVTLADGRAHVRGQLDFLLKPKLMPEEVAFNATGKLTAVRSEVLVKGKVLTAKELSLKADNVALQVGGAGQIGPVPVEGWWRTKLGPENGGRSVLSGKIELSERFVDEFGIGLPPGSVSGLGKGDVNIAFEKGKPGRFELISDLAGLGLSLQQLDWSVSPPQRGSLKVVGQLGEPPNIDTLSLDAGGMQARGTVSLRPNGELDRAEFSQVRVGQWLEAPVNLIGRGAGLSPAVEVVGGFVDLRYTSLSGGGDGGAARSGKSGGPAKLMLDKLQISDGIALTDFRADLDTSLGTQGTFIGKVNGGAVVSGSVVPQNGRSAFRIQSQNAGGVLSSAGLLKQARGGDLDIFLIPVAEAGNYDGSLEAKELRLKDAPALASLLNTLSVVGALEQLDGSGIHFAQVDARFRLTPERVTLLSGSAVGASMGITMDGYYQMQSKRMNMQGVFSPFYLINGIGGVLTRRGEGLFGFNYSLTGPASSPKVKVNPLSALTPGMFREIFRRPAPGVEGGDAPAGTVDEKPEIQQNDR